MEYLSSIIVSSLFALFFIGLVILLLVFTSKQIDKKNEFLSNLSDSEKALILDYLNYINVSFKDLKKVKKYEKK